MATPKKFFFATRKLWRRNRWLIALALCWPAFGHAALEIMAEDDAAPWSQADGSGAANDIVKAAFAAAGVDIQLITVPYTRCKRMVMSGQIAACLSMSADASITDEVVFSQAPLYRVHAQYFHNPRHPLQANSEAEIKRGTVVGIVSSYEYPASVQELAQRGVVLEPAGSEMANLKKVAMGRIDATVVQIDEFKSIEFISRKAGVEGAVAPTFCSKELGSYIGFSTQHPQGLWARDRFNEGFAKISGDGTLQKIMKQWKAQQHRGKKNSQH